MSAHHERERDLPIHCQRGGTGQEPVSGREPIKQLRWTACMIGPSNTDQTIDTSNLSGETPDRTVRGLDIEECTGTEVTLYEGMTSSITSCWLVSRSRKSFVGPIPSDSCPRDVMCSPSSLVVAGFPKSWQRIPNPTIRSSRSWPVRSVANQSKQWRV